MKYIVCTLMGFLFLTEKWQYNILKYFLIKRFIRTNEVPDHLLHYTLSLNSIHIIVIAEPYQLHITFGRASSYYNNYNKVKQLIKYYEDLVKDYIRTI